MNSEPLYRSIAVASTFSPRFVHVLAEAKRVSRRFGSNLSLIYVGERNGETDRIRDGTARSQMHHRSQQGELDAEAGGPDRGKYRNAFLSARKSTHVFSSLALGGPAARQRWSIASRCPENE